MRSSSQGGIAACENESQAEHQRKKRTGRARSRWRGLNMRSPLPISASRQRHLFDLNVAPDQSTWPVRVERSRRPDAKGVRSSWLAAVVDIDEEALRGRARR